MIKIKLSKKAVVYGLPKKVAKSIKDNMTVMNPVWLENHKMGRFNMKTPKWLKLFGEGKRSLSVPIGYLEELMSILNELNLDFDIIDQTVEVSAKVKFTGKLRDYQIPAFQAMLDYNRGTLEAVTGGGKTIIGIAWMCDIQQKTLILVHTKNLLEQWRERLLEFTDLQPAEIGQMGAGKKCIGRRVTIAMVQTWYKVSHEHKDTFGAVICDECHRVSSRTFSEGVTAIRPKYALGLSATTFRRDTLTNFIFWFIGPKRFIIDKHTLADEGRILLPEVIMRETDFVPMCDPTAEYTTMIKELTHDTARNALICSDMASFKESGDLCLALSDRKSHCESLALMLQSDHGINAAVLTGDMSASDQETVIRQMNDKKIQYVCATGQLIGEGFDCKELNNLFVVTPIRFAGRLIQYIGRIMRTAKGKKRPVVYDYVDWQVQLLGRSARHRIKVYGQDNVTFK